jgi:Fur family transcriptional regulator, peroxide stress response regulator
MQGIEVLAQRLRAQGGKVTSQRLLIWGTLVGDQTHPSAEDLYGRLKPMLPGLSLATLYNALNELVEWGEVRRFDAGDGRIHYDPDLTPHAELVCLRCHAIVDAHELPPPASLPDEIAGYRIVMRSEQYYGYCPACRAALAAHEGATAQ